jgi:hypothetical protein
MLEDPLQSRSFRAAFREYSPGQGIAIIAQGGSGDILELVIHLFARKRHLTENEKAQDHFETPNIHRMCVWRACDDLGAQLDG